MNADDREPILTDFVEKETLQLLQDGFAALTGISTSIRDPDGNLITQPAGASEFCELVSATPTGSEACRLSHTRAALLVRSEHKSCRHECHAGLSQFAAPIVVQGHHLGTILIGDRPTRRLRKSEVAKVAAEHRLSVDQLASAAADLEVWDDTTLTAATSFLQQLAGTIGQLCFQSFQLQRRVDELATVYDVAALLAGRAGLQEILDTSTRQLVQAMNLKASSLRLLDADTGELELTSVANLSKKYLNKGPVRLADAAIDQAAIAGETVFVEDCRTDPRIIYKEMAREEGLGSALATAVRFRGKPIGVLWAYMGDRHAFSPFEVSLVEAIAAQLAAAIINARLRAEVRDAEILERQVKHAAEVQRRMIPAKPPENSHYRFGCIYQPSSELGGDFYDFIRFDNGDLGLVVSDVVGKGIPASLMMASARSALRSNARRVTDIGEIIQSVNRRLYHDTLPSEFATAFYMELSEDGRSAKYCNAGHEPLLLLRDGRLSELDKGGLALGIDPDEVYEWAEVELRPGDLMLLFTDGVSEARDYQDRAFGRARVRESLLKHGQEPDATAAYVARQLQWDVRRFVGLAPQGDDITIVAVKVA